MSVTAAQERVVGKDSGQVYGNPELLESLVDEANRSLEKLAGFGVRVDQVWENGSSEVSSAQKSSISSLPLEVMENIAERIRSIESLLLDAPQLK